MTSLLSSFTGNEVKVERVEDEVLKLYEICTGTGNRIQILCLLLLCINWNIMLPSLEYLNSFISTGNGEFSWGWEEKLNGEYEQNYLE